GVQLVEQVEQGAEVARIAGEQPVKHAVVQLDAARGRLRLQHRAPFVVVQRLQRELGAGAEARAQVGQLDAHLRGRGVGGEQQRVTFGSRAVVEVEQRMFRI